VRLAGNALQLGNTFASSQPVVADRMVTLVRQADGRWAVTVPYEGMDVHYRYTLGDGFWNASWPRRLAAAARTGHAQATSCCPTAWPPGERLASRQ
jgi:hypothetical protein